MADNEGVRRRDVLKGIGLTGAAAGLATTNVVPVANEAQAQPATQSHAHAPAPARNDNTADAFRFFTAPEAAVVVANRHDVRCSEAGRSSGHANAF